MLEAGAPRFPHDFPTTKPYREYVETWEASERRRWERTPPAKRVNYERLGIGNPWKAEWGSVLGQCTLGVGGYVPTQRDTVHPWLLSKHLAAFVLDGAAGAPNPEVWLHDKLRTLQLGRGSTRLLWEVSADDLWRGALVQVQVELHGRGTLGDAAVVYPLQGDELHVCRSFDSLREVRFTSGPGEVNSENLQSLELQPSPPDSIMGYLTSGAYSLSRGRPHGIATVAVSRMVEVKKQMLAYVLPYSGSSPRNALPQGVHHDVCGQSSKHELQLVSASPNRPARPLKLNRQEAVFGGAWRTAA